MTGLSGFFGVPISVPSDTVQHRQKLKNVVDDAFISRNKSSCHTRQEFTLYILVKSSLCGCTYVGIQSTYMYLCKFIFSQTDITDAMTSCEICRPFAVVEESCMVRVCHESDLLLDISFVGFPWFYSAGTNSSFKCKDVFTCSMNATCSGHIEYIHSNSAKVWPCTSNG